MKKYFLLLFVSFSFAAHAEINVSCFSPSVPVAQARAWASADATQIYACWPHPQEPEKSCTFVLTVTDPAGVPLAMKAISKAPVPLVTAVLSLATPTSVVPTAAQTACDNYVASLLSTKKVVLNPSRADGARPMYSLSQEGKLSNLLDLDKKQVYVAPGTPCAPGAPINTTTQGEWREVKNDKGFVGIALCR